MRLDEIRPGLWRWTAPHPEWVADQATDSPGDWPADVGCVAYEARDAVALIDALVPADAWPVLDELVAGRPVTVLQTIDWHERSRDDVLARYGASTTVPDGVEPIPVPRAGETLFWIAAHRALVAGDRILGFGAAKGPLRVCPDSWLEYLENGLTGAELRAELRKVLELPIELVLVSHGEPVLLGGKRALGLALQAPRAA